MKKILFYFSSMSPAGGIERVIATLANKFSEFMEVTILVKDRSYSHYKLNDKIVLNDLNNELKLNMNNRFSRIISASENFFTSSRKLKKYLQDHDYDYYYIAHPLNALELYLARGIDKKVLITEHGGIDAYNMFYKKIKQWLYPKGKAYIVPTKTDTELYKRMHFPAICIPHFKSELPYEKALSINNIALSVGRMTEAKRQWILIDLWDRIVNFHDVKDWQLQIVGEGNLKEKYLIKIKELKLENYVKIMPPRRDVDFYYKNASIFLLTSESEGFGMVILEAMSFGLPCISYDCPSGPRDMIENYKNGILVPFDDFSELEKSTLEIIENQGLRNELGTQALLDSNNWNDKNILEKWKKIFQ